MAVAAFSPEWAQLFKDEINRSPVYQQAGKGWKWTVGLVVDAEPEKNFPEARGVVLNLFEGQARDVRVGSAADAQACQFVISGSTLGGRRSRRRSWTPPGACCRAS